MTLKESLCEIVGIVNAMVDAEPWKEPNKATLETALRLYEAIPQPWEETIGEKAADGFYKRGNVYFKLNDFEKSIASFDKAIELDPNDAVAYNNRGGTKRELGLYEAAIDDYDMMIGVDPDEYAFHNRAFLKFKIGKTDDAIVDLKCALQIAGDFLPSYAVLGDCYRALGKNSDAETAYTKALELTTPENLTQNYRPPIRAERGLKALGREVTTNYTQLAIEKGLITEKEIEVL